MRLPPAVRTHLPLPGLVAAACLALAACAEPESPIDQIQDPIIGGTRQTACQWPTAMGAAGCTNTLVHPRIVTTANHCVAGGGPRSVTFGDTWNGTGVVRRVAVQRCYGNGSGAGASGVRGDFGFCVLAEAVNDVPIVPVLFGCETEILRAGQMATLVGYGRTSGTSQMAGVKYAVNVPINRTQGADIYLGNSQVGACNGDSGGPAFVKLADGTWRAFGATSRGSAGCNNTTIYVMIHPFVPWIERTSGIDITPCHDSDGTWKPTENCRGFPINPNEANGAWSTMCQSVERGGLSATCGAPFGGPVPDGAPVFPSPDGGVTPTTDARRDATGTTDARRDGGGGAGGAGGAGGGAGGAGGTGGRGGTPDATAPDTAPPTPDVSPPDLTPATPDLPPPPVFPDAAPPPPPPTPDAAVVNPPPPNGPSGCSCATPGSPRQGGAQSLLATLCAAAVMALGARRRRRR